MSIRSSVRTNVWHTASWPYDYLKPVPTAALGDMQWDITAACKANKILAQGSTLGKKEWVKISPCKGKSLTKELFFCSFHLATRCIRKMQCWRTVLSIEQNSSCFCLFRWYYSRFSFKNTALSKKCRIIIVAADVNLIRLSKKMACLPSQILINSIRKKIDFHFVHRPLVL